MRRVIEIRAHSVYVPGLQTGGSVLDAGLAASLRTRGAQVIECALGCRDGSTTLHVGTNDEASSTCLPQFTDAHLIVTQSIPVQEKTIETVLEELGIYRFACVKLDIKGAEADLLKRINPVAREIAPQWTVEFHDDPEFSLCTATEVDAAISVMASSGFGVLVRNWPARTNVLFLDRKALSISHLQWISLKLRYQYLAFLWRRYTRFFGHEA